VVWLWCHYRQLDLVHSHECYALLSVTIADILYWIDAKILAILLADLSSLLLSMSEMTPTPIVWIATRIIDIPTKNQGESILPVSAHWKTELPSIRLAGIVIKLPIIE
jgi:hypothetical protein